MIKSWFSGIFGFFFTRAAAAIITFAIIIVLVLLPFFKSQLLQMVESQGQTFSNSTIAAITTNLYTESYGEVIEYLNKVLKDTDNILFVVITKNNGEDIVITKDEWHLANKLFTRENLSLGPNNNALHFEVNPLTKHPSFMYHQSIDIGGAPWGMLTVGMSDKQYQYIKNRYTLIIGTVSALLVGMLILIFYRNSRKIRGEIANLTQTGLQLQTGNLAARASEDGAGEIGTLSKAINTMATNLEKQTNKTKQLAQIVEQTNDAFILFDSSLNIVFVNDAILAVTGYPTKHFMGMSLITFTSLLNLNLEEMLHEFDWISTNHQHSPTRDIVIVKRDMSKVDIEIRLESIGNGVGNENNFLAVLSNITSRKHMEKELHQLAFYDKLTDLPNRRKFIDHLKQTIKSYKRNKKSFALFFMDLDNFKFINDTLGHEAGDEFLVQVGNRLKEIFRSNDLVARLGGDEFTVLVEDIKFEGREDVSYLAEKMLRELASKPIYISGRPLQISTSLGIATYPENGQDGDTLIKHADIAMYSAKKAGKNRHAFFSDRMNELLSKRLEIENDLKAAIETNQIEFYYQPIINLANNQLVGAEALVRWSHPQKGYISPAEFIPVAESSDLIITLSDYLLNIAFKQAHEWQSKVFTPHMSVNISVRQFEKPNFIDRLVYFLEAYQLDANKIQLEFTESVMLDSTKETILKFEELKKIGFKIAIDDFGTGYSSLGYIHKLPIDVIKIDRSFVSGMLTNKKTNSIVAAIAKLSNALEIKIVAEGIELESEANKLRQYQCDYGQGYLFDKALPIEEFERKYMQAELQSEEPALY